jgi:hypothetical protein
MAARQAAGINPARVSNPVGGRQTVWDVKYTADDTLISHCSRSQPLSATPRGLAERASRDLGPCSVWLSKHDAAAAFPRVKKGARSGRAVFMPLAAPGPHRTAPVEVQHRNSFDFARLSCWRAATRSATPAATRNATAPSERKEQRRVWGRINAGAALHARLGWALNTQARSDPTQSQSANCPPGVIAFRRVKAGHPYSRGTSGEPSSRTAAVPNR